MLLDPRKIDRYAVVRNHEELEGISLPAGRQRGRREVPAVVGGVGGNTIVDEMDGAVREGEVATAGMLAAEGEALNTPVVQGVLGGFGMGVSPAPARPSKLAEEALERMNAPPATL